MSESKRARSVATVVAGLLLGLSTVAGSGCGAKAGQELEASPRALEGITAASTADLEIDDCAGFAVADAAAILAVPVDQLEAKVSHESWGTDCSFAPRDDPYGENAVGFTLARADSADEAARDMAQLADHAGVADRALGEEQVSHRVRDVGDEALWVAASGSLYVRVGAVTLTVTRPKVESQQLEVVRRIVR